MNNQDKKTFSYKYSFKEQEEINQIRKKYEHQEEDKMEQLRKLDQCVIKKAGRVALIVGILGTLLLGFGMSLCMTDLNQIFGVYKNIGFVVGIILGTMGIIILSCAYSIYNYTLRKERDKIASEIIRLTDELLK